MTEKDIAFHDESLGNYWVADSKDCYTVFIPSRGMTHSVSDSSYERNEDGLSIAICRCKYLARKQVTSRY